MKNTTTHQIRKGFDIRLAGAPSQDVEILDPPDRLEMSPAMIPDLKPRLLVREGDRVRRGSPVVEDKRLEGLRLCAPVSGVIRDVQYGERRCIARISIEPDGADDVERAPVRDDLARGNLMDVLLKTGAWVWLRQRPFSRVADPAVQPKAIFVNAMNTAPFQVDPAVAIRGLETEFRAGLSVLTRLTEGPVHLCFGPTHATFFEAFSDAERVAPHLFRGPHPSGNTSIHIHHIAPIRPGDTVWTIRAADVARIGALLRDGVTPDTRMISLGGPGVKSEARRHYRVREGTPLRGLLEQRIHAGVQRVVAGGALSGLARPPESPIGWEDTSFTVLPEGGPRVLLGWLLPGLFQFSHSRLFLSSWLRRRAVWDHNTLLRGGQRAMVATGLYDRFLPMRIYSDYLIRAILAGDTTESVQLGLLETDPEDFALAAFACPSKMDLMKIIRKGLDDVEAEGL